MPTATEAANGSPVEPGLIQRIVRGAKFLLSGDVTDFYGPGQPLQPMGQDQAKGRQLDYPVAYNMQTRPRAYEPVTFEMLRALADNEVLTRLAIETRKDQMGKLRWSIQRRDGEVVDDTAKAIEDFLQEPDREHDFEDWLRMLLEDVIVIDQPIVYLHRTRGGQLYAAEPIDGATIARKINSDGRTPDAPDPAYQQVIKGLPAVDYTRDELLFKPRNPRTNKLYGYSPVEQILMIVNIALRRQVSQLEFYTSGNIPDMLIAVPPTWTPLQLKELQTYFDLLLTGDTAARRRVRFVPGGVDPHELRPGATLFDQFDEWLARVVCYAFNLPPNAFVKQNNRATAENAQQVAQEEGLAPLMEWTARFMTRLIRRGWNTMDYVFAWDQETDIDPQVQAQIDQIYLGGATGAGMKVRTVQEVRDDHDWGPAPKELEEENAKAPPPVIPPAGSGAVVPATKDEPTNPPTSPSATSKMTKRGRARSRPY